MATFSYALEFAGVPFVSDVARVVRLGSNLAKEQEDESQIPPRKHQPLVDLVDELNKMIDDRYLNEFNLDGYGRKTDALAKNVGPIPNPRIGDYYYPMGATRWSVFRGLATGPMVKAMQDATVGGTAATFTMALGPMGRACNTVASYTINTNLRMLPPRPLGEISGGLDGLFLVTLVDERYWWNGKVTIQPNDVSTWSSLLTTLATALGVSFDFGTIDTVYGQPEPDSQLWVNQESAAVLLDAVAFNIGRVVVRKLDGTYVLRTASDAASTVTTNLTDLSARTAGGNLFCSGIGGLTNLLNSRNTVVPAEYDVTFPKYVLQPIPHYFNTRYGVSRPTAWWEDSYGEVNTITVPITSGGTFASGLSGYSNNYLHTTAKSIYDTEANAALSGTALNMSGCHALALQLAKDRYDWSLAYALDEVFPGIVNWTPDGLHDIVWRYSERTKQASTRVLRTAWNQFPYEFQHVVPLSGNCFTSGVGGHSVPLTVTANISGGVSGTASGINFGTNVLNFIGNVAVSGELFSGGLSIAHILISGGGGGGTVSGINSGYIGSYSSGVVTSGVYPTFAPPQVQIARYFVSGGVIVPGIVSGQTGREVQIMNVSPPPSPGDAPSTITYLDNSTAAASGDRITTPDGNPIVQQPSETVKLKYTDNKWKFAERVPGPPYTITGGGGGPVYGVIPSGAFQGTSGIYVDYSQTPYQIVRSGCMPANVWICSGTVDSNTLGSGAVQSGNIASGVIWWSHLASGYLVPQSGVQIDYTVGPPIVGYGMSSGQVVSGLIGNGAVNSGNLGSGQIAWPHLSSGAVRSGHVANTAVNSGNVSSGQLTWPHLASGFLAGQSGVLIDYSQGPPTVGINIPVASGTTGQDIGWKIQGPCFSGSTFVGAGSHQLFWSGPLSGGGPNAGIFTWDTNNVFSSGATGGSGNLFVPFSGRYLVDASVYLTVSSGLSGAITQSVSLELRDQNSIAKYQTIYLGSGLRNATEIVPLSVTNEFKLTTSNYIRVFVTTTVPVQIDTGIGTPGTGGFAWVQKNDRGG